MTKIAIIEDDPVINQMYRMKFEASGFTVHTASDGQAGVAARREGLDHQLHELQSRAERLDGGHRRVARESGGLIPE